MNKAKNMTTGAGYLLRREDYKRVKKMDRQQFESFLVLISRKSRKQSVIHRESDPKDCSRSWIVSIVSLERRNLMKEIKQCPFCGCGDRRVGIRKMGNNGYRVCCSKCGSLGPHVSVKECNGQKDAAQKEAIGKWNERTQNR